MTTRSITPTRLVLALVTAGVLGGAGATFVFGSHARAALPPGAATAAVLAPTGAVGAPDFSQITERYGPAVVNISVSGMRKIADAADSSEDEPSAQRPGPQGMDPNDPFFDFFRRFQGFVGHCSGYRRRTHGHAHTPFDGSWAAHLSHLDACL